MPKWDIALAALITEKYQNKERDLHTEDFQRLATKHAIRFDDIMDTVLRMVICGVWVYKDTHKIICPITQKEFDGMHKGGRLVNKDVKELNGTWSPLGEG